MNIRETIIQEAREKLKILLIENSEKTDQKKSLNNYMKKIFKFFDHWWKCCGSCRTASCGKRS